MFQRVGQGQGSLSSVSPVSFLIPVKFSIYFRENWDGDSLQIILSIYYFKTIIDKQIYIYIYIYI